MLFTATFSPASCGPALRCPQIEKLENTPVLKDIVAIPVINQVVKAVLPSECPGPGVRC